MGPEENILKVRVMVMTSAFLIYTILEVGQQRNWTSMHKNFAEASGKPLSTNRRDLQKLMKERTV